MIIIGHADWVTDTSFDGMYPTSRAHHWSQRDGSSVCPVGFRVPTKDELRAETLDNGVNSRDTAFTNFLKLPSAGYRLENTINSLGDAGVLWTSSISYNSAYVSYVILFNSSNATYGTTGRVTGREIRCMKPVVTTDAPPVVTLHSSANVEMIQFGSYPVISVVSVDDVDGVSIPSVVARDSQGHVLGSFINTSVAGTYTLTYTATDSAGHTSNTVTVTVTVHPAMKKTGQTKIYDANGTEHTHAQADSNVSLRDDGYYQKGHDPIYVRDDGDETVTDNITGLMWQDDAAAKSVKKQWLTDENYDICKGQNGQTQDISKCTDTSGDTAATYCATLLLGGHEDWRLPTIDELMNITDRSKSDPAIDTVYFKNASFGIYWSSIILVNSEVYAWYVRFDGGFSGWDTKSTSRYVRCVRDGQP